MVMDFSNDRIKIKYFIWNSFELFASTNGSINIYVTWQKSLCVRYYKCSSLAVKIYAHLIFIGIAKHGQSNGTLYFMEINILWLSFKFVRHAQRNSNKNEKNSPGENNRDCWCDDLVCAFQCHCCSKLSGIIIGSWKWLKIAKKCRHLNTSDDKFMHA